MLVCSVSLRPPRAAVAATIAEAVTALDDPGIGIVVFAALVDDPAAVRDTIDAYLGEIMRETATAVDAPNAGLVYATAIDESVTATDVFVGAIPTVVPADVVEAATASSTQDAALAVPTRSAMLPTVFLNPGTSREANAGGVMVNL